MATSSCEISPEIRRGRPPLPSSERADAQIQLRVTRRRTISSLAYEIRRKVIRAQADRERGEKRAAKTSQKSSSQKLSSRADAPAIVGAQLDLFAA